MDYLTESVLSPHGRQITFAHREGTTDLSTVGATCTLWGFTGNEYLLRDLHHLTGWAIDVGAHIGSVSLALAVDYPDLRILAVEALAENCDVIRASLELNNVQNVTVIEAAASDVARKHVGVAYGWTQAENMTDDYIAHSRFIGGMVDDPSGQMAYPKGVSLSSLLKTYKIDRVRFLKIDCEGCEWRFLTSPDIGRVDEIIGEYHFAGRIEGIHALLDKTHKVTFLGGEDTVGLFRATVR